MNTPESKLPEPILDPEQVICDPHHHLMNNAWASYNLDDLLVDLRSGHRVVSTVFMEAGGDYYRAEGPEALRPVGEVDFVVQLNAPKGVMDGIVAFADLLLGDEIAPVLEAHAAAAQGRLSGIRFMSACDPNPELNFLHHHPTPGLLRDPVVQKAIRQVGCRGLSLDCWLYGHQLGDLVDVARTFPDQVFVLDHLGTPLLAGPYADQRDEVLSQWRQGMSELAACPNVRLKMGGLTLAMQGAPWSPGEHVSSEAIADFWRRDVLWCIETFGVQRCMFESNFPIERAAVSYVTLWNAYKRIAAGFSPTERNALFHDTAHQTYLA